MAPRDRHGTKPSFSFEGQVVIFSLSAACVLYCQVFFVTRNRSNTCLSVVLCSYPHGASAQEEQDLCVFGVTIMGADFTLALEALQQAHSQAIGAPKVGLIQDNFSKSIGNMFSSGLLWVILTFERQNFFSTADYYT